MLVPQTKERSGQGSWNEERAGGNSAAQTYDSGKKCKVATPTASELTVQAAQLHEEINERISAISHMDPGTQAKDSEVLAAIQEMCDKFDAAPCMENSPCLSLSFRVFLSRRVCRQVLLQTPSFLSPSAFANPFVSLAELLLQTPSFPNLNVPMSSGVELSTRFGDAKPANSEIKRNR